MNVAPERNQNPLKGFKQGDNKVQFAIPAAVTFDISFTAVIFEESIQRFTF